jgi:AcrR family transcriptional regulator
MARTVNEHEYAAKRNEILDVVQRLVETKGYEQMTIQDLLDDLQISKGALYHYFDSKEALLEGLIERTLRGTEQQLLAIAHHPALSALAQLQAFFSALVAWKYAQQTLVLALLRIWYLDDNALMRQKLHETRVKRFTPLLEVILRQGREEGSMTPTSPDQTSRIILWLLEDLSDALARLLLSHEPGQEQDLLIERIVAASTEAVERILGVPRDSLQLVNTQQLLREWRGSREGR